MSILRTPGREVTDFFPALQAIVNDLLGTMRHRGADGLAALQAGIPLRLAIVEGEHGDPLTLVNPQITVERGPVSEGPEGCLSVLGVSSFVERHQALQVTYEDPLGDPHTLQVEGHLARIIAHEVDHLDGVLCIDRARRVLSEGEP